MLYQATPALIPVGYPIFKELGGSMPRRHPVRLSLPVGLTASSEVPVKHSSVFLEENN